MAHVRSSPAVLCAAGGCCVLLGLAGGIGAQVAWTQAPHAPRESHAMAFDAAAGTVLAFGGYAGEPVDQRLLGSTLVWTDDRWIELSPSTRPPGRNSLALATDVSRRRVVLFGGSSATTNAGLDDTWEWDGANWTAMQPTNRPAARFLHSMAFDAARNRVVLFGGYGSAALLNDTWEWDGANWLQRNPTTAPSARSGHQMVGAPNGLVFLFGGVDRSGALDDLWTWDGASWRNVPQTGSRPSPRASHAMAYDAVRSCVLVMGGVGIQNPRDDLWEWHPASASWTQRTGLGPRARQAHAMAFDSQRRVTLLYGGWDSSRGNLSDTWEWNGVYWVDRGTDSPPGATRYDMALTYESTRGVSVLFGGFAAGPQDDTWSWDGDRWFEHTPTQRPSPRGYAALAHDATRGRTLLFGGSDGWSIKFGDTWEWDGRDWQLLLPNHSPAARAYFALAADTHRGRIVLFGGSNGTMRFDDTWEWDGTDWQQRSPRNRPFARRFHAMAYDAARRVTVLFGGSTVSPIGDTWEWDGTDWTYRLSAAHPFARDQHAMVYDAARRRIVMHGGRYQTTYFTDTWEWDGTIWTQRTTATSPRATIGHAMAWDERRGRTMLHGGLFYSVGTWEYGPTTPARFAPFGAGCAGSSGTPALVAAPFELPWRGGGFTIEVRNAVGGRPAAVVLGASNTQWGGATLPFDLGVAGMPGCSLYASTELVVPVSGAAGTSRLTVPIPDDGALLGGTFFAQALVIDPGVNAAGLVVSNAGAATVGGR